MKLLGCAMDDGFWQSVRKKECFSAYRQELLELWERDCKRPITELPYSDFKRYFVDGNRSIYEDIYFSRRRAMGAASLLALIYPENENYLDYLMDLLYAICNEYTWCLPAHQGALSPNDNTKIDLFASETGFALAEILTLLGTRLEPLIQNRIKAEIDRRIITPFVTTQPYTGTGWELKVHNWAAVCMGSVACTMMLLRPDLTDDNLVDRFEETMATYLSGFREDGVCLEGCGYWHYGFGFFVVYADMIRTFTKGKIDHFKNEKVRTVATFLQKMYLGAPAAVSFADGHRECRYHLGLMHYLKSEYPDEVLVYDPKHSYNYDNGERFCLHLRSAIWLNEEYYNAPDSDINGMAYYAPVSEWFVKRTPAYGFAAKGGSNAELHNHNDVGSFIFAKHGRQVFVDLGAGEYTRQYFSSKERYTILECSSRGHSVPVIDNTYQYVGGAAYAVGTKYENDTFSTDIARTYDCKGLEKLERSFDFTEDTVTLTDYIVYHGEGDVIERFVTLYQPELIRDGVIKVDDAVLTYDPTQCDCVINTESTTRHSICYMIDFKLKPGILTFNCSFQ